MCGCLCKSNLKHKNEQQRNDSHKNCCLGGLLQIHTPLLLIQAFPIIYFVLHEDNATCHHTFVVSLPQVCHCVYLIESVCTCFV